MEQVLAPRLEFKPKNPTSGLAEGFDYGEAGYDPKKCNVGFNEETGKFQIEIKGLMTPKSEEGQQICQEDLNEVIAAFVQDETTIERGLFDQDLMPEEMTQLRMGKIVKDKYPDLPRMTRRPCITSTDAWEKRMAEGVAFLARMKASRRSTSCRRTS